MAKAKEYTFEITTKGSRNVPSTTTQVVGCSMTVTPRGDLCICETAIPQAVQGMRVIACFVAGSWLKAEKVK